jgi:hypothetical protein
VTYRNGTFFCVIMRVIKIVALRYLATKFDDIMIIIIVLAVIQVATRTLFEIPTQVWIIIFHSQVHHGRNHHNIIFISINFLLIKRHLYTLY